MTDNSIFRLEAIEARALRRSRDSLLRKMGGFDLLLLLFGLVITASILFLAFAKFEVRETSRGFLIPSSGVVKVTSSQGGIVTNVLVEVGDRVKQGDILLESSLDVIISTGSVVDDRLALVDRKKSLIEERLSTLDGEFDIRRRSLELSIKEIRKEIEILKDRQIVAEDSVAELSASYERFKVIYDEGTISQTELQATGERLKNAKISMFNFATEVSRREGERENQIHQLKDIESTKRDTVFNLKTLLIDLQNERAALLPQKSYFLQAPVTGIVIAKQIKSGDQVDTNVSLITIIPDEEDLLAVVFVTPQGFGNIELGQDVRLSVDAFPARQFGWVTGSIVDTSSLPVDPKSFSIPTENEELGYAVKVKIDEEAGKDFLNKRDIRTGAAISAEITVFNGVLFKYLTRRQNS